MRYIVQAQRTRVDFTEIPVWADSQEEAEKKADAVSADDLNWEGLEEEVDLLHVTGIKEEVDGPRCPKCGSRQFREIQTVHETQHVSWNEIEGFFKYGQVEFSNIESVEGVECASCGKDLGADFFQPWHQGKTRSEIYGERETSNDL